MGGAREDSLSLARQAEEDSLRELARQPFTVSASRAATFNAVVDFLTDQGLVPKLLDRELGLVAFEPVHTGGSTDRQAVRLLQQRFGWWADCGTDVIFTNAAGASAAEITISTKVTGDSSSSGLRITTSYRMWSSGLFGGDNAKACRTRGRLETALADSIRARVDR